VATARIDSRARPRTPGIAVALAARMQAISCVSLERVVGGASATASSSPDASAVAKRASDLKAGKSQLDIYGYHTNNSDGVGAEVLHRFNDNVSVFANGTVGNKDDKPDASVMGGIRFQW
jgi:hypothetical protein